MTPEQRKDLQRTREQYQRGIESIDKTLAENPGFYERARQIIKTMEFRNCVASIVEVNDNECVGIRIDYETDAPHAFWLRKPIFEIRTVQFHQKTLILSIHFT